MIKNSSQNFKLGIFVLIGTILFILTIYLIGQKKNMFGKTANITTFFQNINGLQEGNNVRYSGINVGTVKSIDMINDSTIKINMIIEEDIMVHIKQNAIATIGSDGLVGNMIINILPQKGESGTINSGDTIESYSKIGTDEILNTLSTTNENAALLTSDLLKITNAIVEGKGTLGVILNDTIMAKDLQKSITNLKNTSNGANKTINELNSMIASLNNDNNSVVGLLLNDTVSGVKIKYIINNLEKSSIEIDKVVTNMNDIMKNIKTGKGTVNYLIEDTTIVNDLKMSMKNINEGTEKFNQNMEALKHNFLFRSYFKKLEKK